MAKLRLGQLGRGLPFLGSWEFFSFSFLLCFFLLLLFLFPLVASAGFSAGEIWRPSEHKKGFTTQIFMSLDRVMIHKLQAFRSSFFYLMRQQMDMIS